MDIQKTYGIFNKSAQKAEELRETKWAQFFETPCITVKFKIIAILQMVATN